MRIFLILALSFLPWPVFSQDATMGEVVEMLESPVEEDRRVAQIALEIAAEEEDPFYFGVLAAHFDMKQPPDLEAAEYYYRLWANSDSEDGLIELGRFYRRQDRSAEFVAALELAREKYDSSISTFGLAYAYSQGVGVRKDLGRSLVLLRELYDDGAIYVPTCFRCEPDDIRMMMVWVLLDTSSEAYDPDEALTYAEEMTKDGDYAGSTFWAGHILTSELSAHYDRAIRVFLRVRAHTTKPSEYAQASFYLSAYLFSVEPSQSFMFAESALYRNDIAPEDKKGLYFVAGLHLLTGYGTDADPERAMDILVEASQAGDPDATAIVSVLNAERVNSNSDYGCKYSCAFVANLINVKKHYEQAEAQERTVAPRSAQTSPRQRRQSESTAKQFFGQLFKFAVELVTAVATVVVEVAESDPYAFGYMVSGAPSHSAETYGHASRVSSVASTSEPSGCKSDYNCPNGSACVKKPHHYRGICLRSVDRWGLRAYEKNLDSFEAGKSTCTLASGCPIGFRCDLQLQQCVK
jgi:TPR repeat protein